MTARNLPVSAQCIKHTRKGVKCKAPKQCGQSYCVRHMPVPKKQRRQSSEVVPAEDGGFRLNTPILSLDDCIREMSRLAAAVFEGTVGNTVASTGLKVLLGILSALETKHKLDPKEVGKRALSAAAAVEAAKTMPISDARRILVERGFDPLFEYIQARRCDGDVKAGLEQAMST